MKLILNRNQFKQIILYFLPGLILLILGTIYGYISIFQSFVFILIYFLLFISYSLMYHYAMKYRNESLKKDTFEEKSAKEFNFRLGTLTFVISIIIFFTFNYITNYLLTNYNLDISNFLGWTMLILILFTVIIWIPSFSKITLKIKKILIRESK